MRERADAIARTLTMEQGKPLAEAKAEILHSADTFEWFAEEGKRAYGQVIPNSAARQTAHDAQASGRRRRGHQPVELPDHAASRARSRRPWRPAAPSSASRPAQTPLVPDPGLRVHDRSGLAGRASPIWCMGPAQEIADEFLENPMCRKISFTGSTEVGKQLMRGCCRSDETPQPGTGRPCSVHRLSRRRSGSRRQDRRHRQVPQQRPGVHRPEPILRSQGRAEEVHRGGRRIRQGS